MQAVPEQDQESLPSSPAHKASLPAMHIREAWQPSTQERPDSSVHKMSLPNPAHKASPNSPALAHKTSLPSPAHKASPTNPAHKTSLPSPAYKAILASGHKASLPNILEEDTRAKEEEVKVEVNFQIFIFHIFSFLFSLLHFHFVNSAFKLSPLNFQLGMDEDVRIEMGDVGESQDWMEEAQRRHCKRGVNLLENIQLSDFHLFTFRLMRLVRKRGKGGGGNRG